MCAARHDYEQAKEARTNCETRLRIGEEARSDCETRLRTEEEIRTDCETRLGTGEEARSDCETRLRTGEYSGKSITITFSMFKALFIVGTCINIT
jgi:chromosome segregation ATPase